MSDAETPRREWRFYIEDMIGFAEKVLAYTEGMDQTTFTDRGMTHDAVLRNLELIGEAATHVPEEIRQAHPEIPWRMIIATRNRLIHAYLTTPASILAHVIRDDIPPLLVALKKMDGT